MIVFVDELPDYNIQKINFMADCLELYFDDEKSFENMKQWCKSYEIDIDWEIEDEFYVLKHYWR